MIPWDPRRGWLVIGLAGLEVTLLLPMLYAVYRRPFGVGPTTLWAGLWTLLCLWVLAVDLVSALQPEQDQKQQGGGMTSSQVSALIFAAILLSSLILVRWIGYPSLPLGDPSWASVALRRMVSFEEGLSLELGVVLTNILLWQRALQAGGRSLHFRSLTARVRWLWLLSLFASVYAAAIVPVDMTRPMLASFPIGLLCLIVGRSDEKATATGSVGRPLHSWHLAQMVVIVLALCGLGLTPLAAPAGWLAAVLDTVFGFVMLAVMQVLLVVVFLLYPLVLQGLDWFIRAFKVSNVAPPNLSETGVLLSEEIPTIRAISQLPPWALSLLRAGAVVFLLVLAALVVAMIGRAIRPRRLGRIERERSRWAIPDGSLLRQGLARVQDALALARQMGIGQQLLAATSVRNIYANLTRMATQRGYPRRKHQPPDRYIHDLVTAFGGHEQPLERITSAYMRVHYGDHTIDRAELEQIQSDYRAVRKAVEA